MCFIVNFILKPWKGVYTLKDGSKFDEECYNDNING